MTDTKYEGWTNRETWLIATWLDNDASLYREVHDLTFATLKELVGKSDDELYGACALMLKDFFGKQRPTLFQVWADLLSTALGRVNWAELSHRHLDEGYLEEARRQAH